jgi:hypothetical protein
MDFTVKGTPEEVLDKVENFLHFGWGAEEPIVRRGAGFVSAKRNTAESGGMTALHLILSFLTVGLWLPIWALNTVFKLATASRVKGEAEATEDGRVRILTTGSGDWQGRLDSFVKREFV